MICGKKCFILFLMFLTGPSYEAWGCYAVIVGRQASADGSVLVGHLEQNGGRRLLNLRYLPRQHCSPGTMVPLRRGGQLPQVAQTWALIWSQNPGMEFSDAYLNEWGVGVVSDGCPSRAEDYQTLVRKGEIRDGGIGFMLRRLIAQRARTAREGVELAGGWLDRFGYADSGRTYVIADPREAWLLAAVRGRNWVAQRVPDDAVVLLANVYIHGGVNLSDRSQWLASPQLVDYAVKQGWWDPEAGKPFHFAAAYSAERSGRPDPRQAWGQHLVTGRRGAWPPKQPLPWCVKPARKMSVADVMAVLRNTEGVPLSTPRTQEGAVFQLRRNMPPAIGCVYWRATAEPATSIFTPWYVGITETPHSYYQPADVATQLTLKYHFNPPAETFDLNPQLAWWVFKGLQDLVHQDYTARLPKVQSTWAVLEQRFLADQEAFEKKAGALWDRDPAGARTLLTGYCAELSRRACREAEKLVSDLGK
jgi:dipeptidase